MPIVVSVMRFRTVEDAGFYSDIVEDVGFEPTLRQTDEGFAVVTSVSSDDDFEINETKRILASLTFMDRDPIIRVLTDEDILRTKRAPRVAPVAPITPPEVTREVAEVSPEKRAYLQQYRQTEAFKMAQQRYQQSSGGREAQSKYARSERGRVQREKYQTSEKGKAARQRFQEKQKEKRRLARLHFQGKLVKEEDITSFEELFGETP